MTGRNLPMQQLRAADRTSPGAQSEHRQQEREHAAAGTQRVPSNDGEFRQQGGTDGPEPTQRQQRQPNRALLGGKPHHIPGRGYDAPVDAERRVRRRHREDPQRPEQSTQRKQHPDPTDDRGAVGQQHKGTASNGTNDDGQKCRCLDQPVARDQLMFLELLRQHPVFDRPEQRRLGAEANQDPQQRRHAFGQERRHRREHQNDLGRLIQADHPRLGEAVGNLAAGGGDQNIRKNEHRPGQCRQARSARAQLEDGEHDHGVLHQIIVQRAAGLRQHERPHAAGCQQQQRLRFMHDRGFQDRALKAVATSSSARSVSPPLRRP